MKLLFLIILFFEACTYNNYYVPLEEEQLSIWDLDEIACNPEDEDCEVKE